MNCMHCLAFHQDKTIYDIITMTAEKAYYCDIEDRKVKFLEWTLPLPCIDNRGRVCVAKTKKRTIEKEI